VRYSVELAAAILEMARVVFLSADPSAGVLDSLGALTGQLFALVEGAYTRAPILWLVLSALLILPAAALISLATRAGTRLVSRETALRAVRRRVPVGDPGEDIPEVAAPPVLPRSQAWLTVEGRSGGPMALAGDTIRIGRHGDNDIRLADWSVHRHHAVIERTPDEAFVIADLSGKDGTGLRVNGERTERAQLADGDLIELGRSRLRFENAPV
jgi:hypothetical protein